jgi:hypothetical protein
VPLSILALLPYMIQRFNEPDEFCLSCAATVGQVRSACCVHGGGSVRSACCVHDGGSVRSACCVHDGGSVRSACCVHGGGSKLHVVFMTEGR